MRGLVVGRFQPLHKGHAQLLKTALEECTTVAVAVGSTQGKPSLRNPFGFAQRRAMVLAIAPQVEVFDVPDIHDAAGWVAHLLAITGPVGRVYGNDESWLPLFEQAHIQTRETGLVERERFEGAAIRRMMVEDDASWRKAVPPQILTLLESWRSDEILRHLE